MDFSDKRAFKMHPDDNVATCLSDISCPGEEVQIVNIDGTISRQVRSKSAIPFGNKISLGCLNAGDPVYKYGHCIGGASRSIDQGEWVHIHNLESRRIPIPEGRLKTMIAMLNLPEMSIRE